MKIIFIFSTITLISYYQVSVAQYPDPFYFTEVPDLLSGTNPAYTLIPKNLPTIGESFFYLRFGILLTRVTATNGIHGRHEYSRFDPFNQDHSMIILDPEELWNVYTRHSYPYNPTNNLLTHIDLEELRWNPNDPNMIWGIEDFSIKSVNISTKQTTVVKDFTQNAIIGPIIAQENETGRLMYSIADLKRVSFIKRLISRQRVEFS